MRTVIVTAADDGYLPLLRGLVGSLRALRQPVFDALAVLDVGLSDSSRAWLGTQGAQVVDTPWTLPVPEAVRAAHPHWRALTARPFLPELVPGHDLYLWIDADCWVQLGDALGLLGAVARQGVLAAVPEVDRCYRQSPDVVDWRVSRMAAGFGEAAAQRCMWDAYFNAGVFGLRADAPHWAAWARHFAQGIEASEGRVVCDQSALNQALWADGLPVLPLPAVCNWLCNLSVPAWDPGTRLWGEPYLPTRPLGILHLAARTKAADYRVNAPGLPAHGLPLTWPGVIPGWR